MYRLYRPWRPDPPLHQLEVNPVLEHAAGNLFAEPDHPGPITRGLGAEVELEAVARDLEAEF